MHARIAERIADSAELTPADTVLEIGPGTGMLTRPLLQRVGRVVAVEADPELFQQLHGTFAEEIASGKLKLVQGDIRTFDPSTLPAGYAFVANIPYYLTGDIFRKFLASESQPSRIVVLVQKEVAERIAREKKGNILALSVKVYGEPKYEFTVPRGAFVPAPNVDSAVLSIKNISRKHFSSPVVEKKFFDYLHAGFAHKRKFVRKNLEGAGLDAGTIPEKARAEDLSLADWLQLIA